MDKKKLFKAGVVATIAAGIIYGIEKLVFHVNTVDNTLEVPDGHTYQWQFGEIFYTVRGSGRPVLLLHDQEEGASGYEWTDFESLLRKYYKVYTVDLPGFGRSEKAKSIYTGYMYVHAVREFVKDVIGEKTDIITSGSSMSTAIFASLGNKDLAGRMIFINPPEAEETSKLPVSVQRFAMKLICVPLVGTLIYQIMQSKAMQKKRLAKQSAYAGDGVTRADVKAYSEAAHLGGADGRFAYAGRVGNMTSMNVLHALKDEPGRYLFVGGGEDAAFEKTAGDYRAYLPSAQVRTIEGAGSMPHMDFPGETESACLSWLEENETYE